jgi:glycine cleavage system H protein
MTDIPEGLCYTYDNLWARREPDGTVTVGLTHYAVWRLSKITLAHPPGVDRVLTTGAHALTLDTVNGAVDYLAPVSGRVTAVNAQAVSDPESIGDDPYGAWLFRLELTDPDSLGNLLDAEGYRSLIGGQ